MGALAVFAAAAVFVSAGDGIVRMERFENPVGVYTTTNRAGSAVFQLDSNFPDTPGIGIHVLEPGEMRTLEIRIPDWVDLRNGGNGTIRVNGEYMDLTPSADGRVSIDRSWQADDCVILGFRNPARRVDVGEEQVEVRRGDVVYVAEGDSLADDVTFVVRIEKVGGVRWQVLDASDGRVFTPRAMGRAGQARFRRLAAQPKTELPLETADLQRRIDAAAAAGGGRVTIGPGVHRSGTIYLKSGVNLHLEKGAVLLASDRLDDYNALDAFPQNAGVFASEGWQAKHLIVCIEQENVSITGEGTIDGNGRAFFENSAFQTIGQVTWRDGGINSKDFRRSARPGQLVEFCESKNVRVEGVTFVDPPAWTLFFHGCENVTATNLRIKGDTRHMNTDGIDIDACRHVRVSRCDIRTGDDAIAIRGAPARLRDKTRACEDIVVEDVVAKVSASGCRIGVGDGVIRNVRLSNVRIESAGVGLHVHSAYKRIGGAEISDITLSCVSLLDTAVAVRIEGSNGKRPHDICFEDVLIERTDYVPGEMVRVINADNVSLGGIRYLDARVKESRILELAGTWRLMGADQLKGMIDCPITVPGGVHSALLAAGLMPDTFKEDNEFETAWVSRTDWTVSRTFDVSAELLTRKDVILRLEDCDTFCTVRVNGLEVGRTTNRFRRWEFDVKRFLKPGRNEIAGLFESPVRIADAEYWRRGRTYPMSNAPLARNQALIRKPACHAGWDWGPEQEVMGFCGTVALIASDRPRIDYVYTAQTFNDDLSHCTLDVFTDLSDGTTVTNRLEIDNPPLWWPNGAGEQKFYEYALDETGHICDRDAAGTPCLRKIGLRKLEVLNERTVSADGKDELSMVFRVNNRRLFMKGANWIPCDAYENRQTPERYRDLLESAVAANMNMIRLWGGGQYEKDVFYETCDELGLLVWHDMMASCAVYPGDDGFLGEIRAELSHQLRRLRDHASIALWCGDNECLGALRWFPQLNYDREGYKAEWVKRSQAQGECVAKYDPTRTYWPSSPCCGPGDFGNGWKDDSKGDMHQWGVWGENKPLEEFYRFRPRFCSEFGFQSFPSMEVALTFASEKDILAREWNFEYHQKAKGGNDRIRKTMLRYFGEPKDVPSELLLSQFQQGLAIKTAVDAWRAQRPRCMGTLFWQLNDNWPVSSWSSVEYGGKWKPLQYMAKRFFAPLGIVAAPDGTVTALNDTNRRQEGSVTLDYVGFDGKVIRSEKTDVVLDPDSATKIAAFRPQEGAFLHLSLRVTDGEAENDWLFSRYCESALACPDLKVEVLGQTNPSAFRLRLTASAPAFFVWANVRGVRGEFSDNCLTLLPGKPREIVFRAKEDCPLRLFGERLTVSHLAALIK